MDGLTPIKLNWCAEGCGLRKAKVVHFLTQLKGKGRKTNAADSAMADDWLYQKEGYQPQQSIYTVLILYHILLVITRIIYIKGNEKTTNLKSAPNSSAMLTLTN